MWQSPVAKGQINPLWEMEPLFGSETGHTHNGGEASDKSDEEENPQAEEKKLKPTTSKAVRVWKKGINKIEQIVGKGSSCAKCIGDGYHAGSQDKNRFKAQFFTPLKISMRDSLSNGNDFFLGRVEIEPACVYVLEESLKKRTERRYQMDDDDEGNDDEEERELKEIMNEIAGEEADAGTGITVILPLYAGLIMPPPLSSLSIDEDGVNNC